MQRWRLRRRLWQLIGQLRMTDPINWLAVLGAALAAFLVGALWYGLLFPKRWQKAAGLSDEALRGGPPMAVVFTLTILLELAMAAMLGHNFARIGAATLTAKPHLYVMMSGGQALAFIIPALGVNYLYLRKRLSLFALDAAHWLLALLAMGAVFYLAGR